ncbi:phage-related baseplate assembly protein [Chelatococcus caeni]|uniref:Phage-related baseplate assembly protein n=1 Tax=Chelatococcus caeni TaxID=1348468 RepID=A0A840BY13_9HYPH|nr:phage-related baseplate assembly protein [Chelatococcus caeni]
MTLPPELVGLPPPEAIEEISFEAILVEMMADFQQRWDALRAANPDLPAYDVGDLETDPVKIALEAAAYREVLVRARINDVVRAHLIAYARGGDLDNLGPFYDCFRMAGEDDDRYLRRIILAIQGRSTGGTEPRYRAIALAASLRVADAAVFRIGKDPTVHVALYAADNGGVADAQLIETVRVALHDKAKIMVSDTIVVRSAVFAVVDVEADVWLLPQTPETILPGLETAVRSAWAAATGLGFDLTRSWLTAQLMQRGIQRVEILTPAADVEVPPYEAVSIGAIRLNNRGRGY